MSRLVRADDVAHEGRRRGDGGDRERGEPFCTKAKSVPPPIAMSMPPATSACCCLAPPPKSNSSMARSSFLKMPVWTPTLSGTKPKFCATTLPTRSVSALAGAVSSASAAHAMKIQRLVMRSLPAGRELNTRRRFV